MHQFTFEIKHRSSGRIDQVRCTARTAPIARANIVAEYGRTYAVADEPSIIDPPHKCLGEIDASSQEHEIRAAKVMGA